MKEVEAIKTKEDITTIHTLLHKHAGKDFADIFKLGINVAFRIGDLLSIKYIDIDLPRREIILIESKTGKKRIVRLNDNALVIIQARRQAYPDDIHLFQSHGCRGRQAVKPLDRSTVSRKFKAVGEMVGIHLGTHSMRKTRGYMMHKAGVHIVQIMRVLNHTDTTATMAYIGLTHEETMQTYDDFVL